MRYKTIKLGLATTLVLLGIQSNANAVLTTEPIESFSGEFTSIPFTLNGESVETGPITTTLDPSAESIFGLDADFLTGLIDVTLLLDFPLLDVIGEPAPSIRIIETGPLTLTPIQVSDPEFISDGDIYDGELLLSGGGVIDGPSLFEGVSFNNANKYSVGLKASQKINNSTGQQETTLTVEGKAEFGPDPKPNPPRPNPPNPDGGAPPPNSAVREVPYELVDGTGTVTIPDKFGGGSTSIDGSGTLTLFSQNLVVDEPETVPEPSIFLGFLSLATFLFKAKRVVSD